VVRRLLESHGASVATADSVAEALDVLQQERPHLMLCDIGMPGEDGYELLRRLRVLDPSQGGDTPAVALTALARPEDRRRALLAGFHMHLAKPLESAELIAVVASLSRTVRRAAPAVPPEAEPGPSS
jgi:CheY-like chemotaxis protein